jgi:tetratricopeptide (TPR) repeat protein
MRLAVCLLCSSIAASVASAAQAAQCPAAEPKAVASSPSPAATGIAAELTQRREALQNAIRSCGADSALAAEAMTALASLYIDLQRYLDAEPLLIAAGLTLAETDDPAATAILVGRARIALARGEAEKARRWAEQAARLPGAQPQAQSAALRVLGRALAAEGRSEAAEPALRRSLEIARAGEDSEGIATAHSLAALGNLYLRQKRYAAALPLLEDAARIDRDRPGPAHPQLADDFHDIAVAWLETGRAGDAAKALRYAIEALERADASDTPRLAYITMTLARAEARLGRQHLAKSLFDKAGRILGAAERAERSRESRV